MLGYDPQCDAGWTQQRMLPEFIFDKSARASSEEELTEQLPERLFEFRDGIAFNSLFSTLTNECPVTAKIMKAVVSDLAKSGVIVVKDKTGTKTRRAGVQNGTDIIIPSRQKRIFLNVKR